MPTLSSVPEDELTESLDRILSQYTFEDENNGTNLVINNGDTLIGFQDELLDLINQQIKSVLDSIPEPTITDVFPSKPYDGTKTYEDMLQVVKYYKSTIQKIRSRYE